MHNFDFGIPVNVEIVCREAFHAISTRSVIYGRFRAGTIYFVTSYNDTEITVHKGHYGLTLSYDELFAYFEPTWIGRSKKIKRLLDSL